MLYFHRSKNSNVYTARIKVDQIHRKCILRMFYNPVNDKKICIAHKLEHKFPELVL
jgi:hypothetical protein